MNEIVCVIKKSQAGGSEIGKIIHSLEQHRFTGLNAQHGPGIAPMDCASQLRVSIRFGRGDLPHFLLVQLIQSVRSSDLSVFSRALALNGMGRSQLSRVFRIPEARIRAVIEWFPILLSTSWRHARRDLS